MELMGKWNWYLPSWLHWLPDLRVDAEPAPRAPGRTFAERPGAGGGD
jgi:RND superfamily putative drug exporter